ncbi:transporter substrate-binding domain-containing protein [Chelativorans salis]|uniref:Transporter substrate-binding domain-containing protein n=1 Tax=Chelativorans salis TaxID=2978478 RepID=A0ABT2LX01_9HYPH|nr:transporter substrate-binding domain-containing protein [Chelativorans sp. EGI FJ00035]MCT7377719.1 transporter substrate-binding domain-containing protein [Chelativorans sp. EGI FJ00035]
MLALAILANVLATGGLRAQEEGAPPSGQPLKVGLYVSPPFVMREDNRFTGMAVELWERVASRLDLQFDYQEIPTIRDLVQATVDGDLDIALTNLTITEGRAQRIDFTHPWYDAGLRLMVDEDQGAGFWDVVAGLRESGHLRAYAWLAFVIVVATALLTLFDRWFDKDFPRRWRDGIAESFYAVMSVATSGRPPARKNLFGWIGRIGQALWLVCGIAVLAYLTSSVTSVMTTLSLTNQINSIADLPGKTAGVFTGSVAEEYARENGIAVRSYREIEGAVAALVNGRIDAVIADAPVLEYYALQHPDVPVTVVGRIFAPDKYGFGLQHTSELTRPLTVEIIGEHDSGALETLRTKYFGEREQ